MDTNKKGNYNVTFWALAAGAAVGVLGSAYYLYSLIAGDEDLAEEDMRQLEDLKRSVEEDPKGELTVETVIQIMSMSNRISEEIVKKSHPDLDDRRRQAINDPELYEKMCQEVFEAKEQAYQEAMNKVMGQFGKFDMDEMQKLMAGVPPQELEKLSHKYDKQTFTTVPDESTVRQAYAFYGKIFEAQMKEFQKMIAQHQKSYDPSQDQYFFLRLLMLKMKVDDLLYLKYNYTEPQIKYMLFEYNLMDDPEIKRINSKLMMFDQMFGGMAE